MLPPSILRTQYDTYFAGKKYSGACRHYLLGITDWFISKTTCVCGAKDILADELLPNKTLMEELRPNVTVQGFCTTCTSIRERALTADKAESRCRYARCTRSVSIVIAAYYAHLTAFGQLTNRYGCLLLENSRFHYPLNVSVVVLQPVVHIQSCTPKLMDGWLEDIIVIYAGGKCQFLTAQKLVEKSCSKVTPKDLPVLHSDMDQETLVSTPKILLTDMEFGLISMDVHVKNVIWWEKYDVKGWCEKGSHKYGQTNERRLNSEPNGEINGRRNSLAVLVHVKERHNM
ncbi:hypothetical protein Tco_1035012 [Tanacetum coccineum]